MLPQISIWGRSIPLYGLMLTLGLLFACLLAVVRLKKAGLPWENFVVIAACGLGVGLAGAKAAYALTAYSLPEIAKLLLKGEFALLFGGAVFYGGLIGGGLGAMLGCYIAKTSFWRYEMAIIPALPLAHAFGRIGCFCAGCCYGIPVARPFGFAFADPIGSAPTGVPLLPIQLIEAGTNLVLVALLLRFYRKKRRPGDGVLVYLTFYAIIRFILEYFRGDEIRGRFYWFSTSQWISLLILAGVLVSLLFRKKRQAVLDGNISQQGPSNSG